MSKFLLRSLLYSLFLSGLAFTCYSQKPLTPSRQSSYYTYIYKLNDADMLSYYKQPDKAPVEKMIRTLVDSFKTDKLWKNTLPGGNYLKVYVDKNKLVYLLIENHSANLQLLRNNNDLNFILTDPFGNELPGAVAKVKNTKIEFDAKTRSYHATIHAKNQVLQVDYMGITNFYRLQKTGYYGQRLFTKRWFKDKWDKLSKIFSHDDDDDYKYRRRLEDNINSAYTGFIVFNKPMYKPGDTVKFKAFALHKRSRTPVTAPQVIVRIKESYDDNGTIIGTVNSYRDGAYSYEFVLTDSLKLKLDNEYTISIEDPSSRKYDLDKYDGGNDEKFLLKRKVYASGKFNYEDYELKSTKLNLRVDRIEHGPGTPVSVYLKATDENDLPVTDGRVTLTLKSNYIRRYAASKVFVPDTLWVHQLTLDPVGETKIILPDSILPKANFNYTITADLLNSDNEHQFESKYIVYNYKPYNISTDLSHDTLKADFQYLGKEKPATAILQTINKANDTVASERVTLPLKMVINPDLKGYYIKTDSAGAAINISDFDSEISFSGERTNDSLFVKFDNPRHIPFEYWVYDGSHLMDAGKADTLTYKRGYTKSNRQVAFIINYVWGGISKWTGQDINYRDKLLKINVIQPMSVYPGQQATTTIEVKDMEDRPVTGTDITAWSFTKKFEAYKAPYVPYLGKEYHSGTKPYSELRTPDKNGVITLNWQKYSHQMGLDSIAYFQFTHPTSIYGIEESAPDSITQIAPFAVYKGEVINVDVIYIDEKPVYFSQAKQLERYSFAVRPGAHDIRIRTANELVSLKNINAEKGKKLIISVNLDSAINKIAHFIKMPDSLTTYEAELLSKYMIKVVPDFDSKLATIEQGDHIFLLNPNTNGYSYYHDPQEILTGPLTNDFAYFNLRGELNMPFVAEPGFSYLFQPGLLKQKSIAGKYPFNTFIQLYGTSTSDYTQHPLTKPVVDSIWQNYLDLRSNTTPLFINEPITDPITGKLVIKIDTGKNGKLPFIKNVILYRNDYPDFIMVYPGNNTELGNLAPGNYRLFFLLKGDKYYIKDGINVKPNGTNFYLAHIMAQPADSVSIKINDIIIDRPGRHKNTDGNINNDALRLKETFNEKYLDNKVFNTVIYGKVLESDDKQPIIGGTVRIKGSGIGTNTDVNGQFKLKVPSSGKLIISFVGYITKEISIRPDEYTEIWLDPSHSELREVVVTGYLTQLKKDISGSVATVSENSGYYDMASVSINLRGNRSMEAGSSPLIIVDGVPVDSMNGIDPSLIENISVLKSDAATAIYGISGSKGVIIISTKKKKDISQVADGANPGTGSGIRHNFSDYAYWQPKLTTDAQGKTSFTTTFPDDITNWRTFIIAINGQKQSGFKESQVKSFKPLSANLLSPQFAVRGDKMNIIGKVLNYTTDTVKVNRIFSYNSTPVKQGTLQVKNSKIDTLNVTAAGTDSLTFEYTIKRENGYFDGERRKIPLIEQGTQETKGVFEALEKDTTVNLKFDPALGLVTFRAEASVLPALLEETDRLRNYQYLCNEQLASKLIGLLAEKHIKKFLGEPFSHEKNILDIIKKLQQNRRSQGTWGWWKDTDEELWVSLHVVDALLDAEKEGYDTELDKPKLIEYLVYQLESYKGQDKLYCLELLKKLDAKVDYEKYTGVVEKEFAQQKDTSKYDRFRLMLLKQQMGLRLKIDSLLNNLEHHTMFGNIYWGENSYSFFDNSIQISVLAYKIIRTDGRHPELLSKIRGYFLEQRKDAQWRNTYESSLILQTILPDLLTENKQIESSSITLSGAKNETIAKFPYTVSLNPGELGIAKTGTLPVYITGYQQFWNKVPVKVSKDFIVNTWFERNGNKIARLKGGEPVELKVEVTARGDADYVMINIPIPAGCSYENKEQSWQNEVHREYFKDRVSIFSRKLKQGTYTFTVKLLPRYDGIYNINPAKAEMMYFPVFYGREGMKKVAVD
jgi:alpha-2-macroglobulin